jgi:hypothetical protein
MIAEHHSVEPVVVLEASDLLQAEALGVHGDRSR